MNTSNVIQAYSKRFDLLPQSFPVGFNWLMEDFRQNSQNYMKVTNSGDQSIFQVESPSKLRENVRRCVDSFKHLKWIFWLQEVNDFKSKLLFLQKVPSQMLGVVIYSSMLVFTKVFGIQPTFHYCTNSTKYLQIKCFSVHLRSFGQSATGAQLMQVWIPN